MQSLRCAAQQQLLEWRWPAPQALPLPTADLQVHGRAMPPQPPGTMAAPAISAAAQSALEEEAKALRLEVEHWKKVRLPWGREERGCDHRRGSGQ